MRKIKYMPIQKNINMYSQNVFLQNVINKNHTDFKVNLKKYLAYAGSWVH